MNRLYILFLVLSTGFICKGQDTLSSNLNKYYPVNQLRSDFVFFRTVLEKAHPGLYHYQPKDSVDHYFNEAQAKLIRPMNELEYWEILRSIVAKLGSGHTDVSLSKETIKQINALPHFVLPFNVYTENGRLYVQNTIPLRDTLLKPGSELLVINNEYGTSILKQMQGLTTGDGYSTSFKDHKIELGFRGLYNLLHGEQSQYLITYSYKGVIKTRLFKALKLMYSSKALVSRTLPYVTYPADMPSTAILRVPDFEYEEGYASLHRKLFKDIRQHNVENLIIDLRSNPGGKLKIAVDLMQYFMTKEFKFSLAEEGFVNVGRFKYLADRTADGSASLKDFDEFERHLDRIVYDERETQLLQMHTFKGKIYLLVNGGTYSAAALSVMAIKNQRDCVVIGEETGGGATGCDGGTLVGITLPETHLKLYMPLLWMYAVNKGGNYGRGLIPDMPVSTEEKERYFSLGLNPSMEIVKAMIITSYKNPK